MAEVRLIVFQKMLEKKLFPDNTFLKYSKNAGQPSAKSIEIPQSTGGAESVIGGVNADYYDETSNLDNATALTPVIRVNDKKTYSNIIMRPPNPIVFETLQDEELTYNKANQVAEEETDELNTGIANYVLTQWQPTVQANIIPTTGLDKAGTEQQRTAATGAVGGYATLVKKFAYADLMALEKAIKKQNLTGGSWYALPTVELWDDLKQIVEIVDYEKTGNETMLKKGIVGKWGSVNFLDPRQNDRWEANVMYDLTSTPVGVAYGGALNANCVSALMVWNDKYVERNQGGIKFFSRKNDPVYMGDLVNWGVRVGGTSRRLDEKGVIAVYEAPTT